MVGATLHIMILILGAAICQLRGSLSSITIIVPPGCRVKNSRG
jgi:hypothetical protein